MDPSFIVRLSSHFRLWLPDLRRRFDDVDTMLRGWEVTARLVPIERFEPLREAIDDALDRELAEGAADGAARERAARERHGAEPGVPAAVMRAEIEGVHPIAAWRKHRGQTQAALAAAIGIDRGYLALIERRARSGSLDTLAKIARALGCLIEDLIDGDEELGS